MSNSDEDVPSQTQKVSNKYDQKYNKHWEKNSTYIGWLCPSEKGKFYAFCRACNSDILIKSGKQQLDRHSKSKKHENNCQSIVSQPQTLASVQLLNLHSDPESDDETSPSKKNQYAQRFRDAWFSESDFKFWLEKVPDDSYKAKCKFCNVFMTSELSTIKKHQRSHNHRRNFLPSEHLINCGKRIEKDDGKSIDDDESSERSEINKFFEEYSNLKKAKIENGDWKKFTESNNLEMRYDEANCRGKLNELEYDNLLIEKQIKLNLLEKSKIDLEIAKKKLELVTYQLKDSLK